MGCVKGFYFSYSNQWYVWILSIMYTVFSDPSILFSTPDHPGDEFRVIVASRVAILVRLDN
jgi:hypothetical protein